MTEQLLTPKQVAEILQCSQSFVLERARKGELVGNRIGGPKRPRWRFERSAVEAYIQQSEYQPTSIDRPTPKPLIKPAVGLPLLDRICAKRNIKY